MASCTGGGYSSRKPVRIVIISTQYVETDATSFKSVVQKLTGRDSDSDSDDHQVHVGHAAMEARKAKRKWDDSQSGHNRSSFLIRDSSFKEFDRLLGEMPQLITDDVHLVI